MKVLVLGKHIGNARDIDHLGGSSRFIFYGFIANELGIAFLNGIDRKLNIIIDFYIGEVYLETLKARINITRPNWSVLTKE